MPMRRYLYHVLAVLFLLVLMIGCNQRRKSAYPAAGSGVLESSGGRDAVRVLRRRISAGHNLHWD